MPHLTLVLTDIVAGIACNRSRRCKRTLCSDTIARYRCALFKLNAAVQHNLINGSITMFGKESCIQKRHEMSLCNLAEQGSFVLAYGSKTCQHRVTSFAFRIYLGTLYQLLTRLVESSLLARRESSLCSTSHGPKRICISSRPTTQLTITLSFPPYDRDMS